MLRALASVTFAASLIALVGCSSESSSGSTDPSSSSTSGDGGSGAGHSTSASGGSGGSVPVCGEDPSDPNETLDGTTDPAGGVFTLEQALDGLPEGPGPLRAVIDTEEGVLTCVLRDDAAPNSVANFVGLARGTRPWLDPATNHWVKRRFYDGLTWHRVISGFVAQGGDPKGNGTGGPGYDIPDEIGLEHVAGAMAWANAGPNTQGSQYYVTDGAQHFLDPNYTVFGLCTPAAVISGLTGVPTDAQDKPVTPIHMTTVKITRCAETK